MVMGIADRMGGMLNPGMLANLFGMKPEDFNNAMQYVMQTVTGIDARLLHIEQSQNEILTLLRASQHTQEKTQCLALPLLT
jgi:hypothetical protein